MPVHGNAVLDFLGENKDEAIPQGVFFSLEMTICHASYNIGNDGQSAGSMWSSPVLYWFPDVGVKATSGPDEGAVAPAAITLRHELTHAWIDQFHDSTNVAPEAATHEMDVSHLSKEDQVHYASIAETYK